MSTTSRASSSSTKRSPKTPWLPFSHRIRDVEDTPFDLYAMMSLIAGVLAITIRVKAYVWISLIFFIASVATSRYSEMDVKQVMASFVLVVMAIFNAYIQPVMVVPPK